MSKEINNFELAARNKYRFPYKGTITAEDLWDLTVASLDLVFKTLNKQSKLSQEESLLNTRTKEDETLDNQIAIVKYIVEVKQKEAADRALARGNKEKKEKIAAILADKQDETLKNLSEEELLKMMGEM